MRISDQERISIVDSVLRILPTATIYLYGSRIDDSKKGWDIDLLIVLPSLVGIESFGVKIRLSIELERKLGERRIDITLACPQDLMDDPFLSSIWPHKVNLLSGGL